MRVLGQVRIHVIIYRRRDLSGFTRSDDDAAMQLIASLRRKRELVAEAHGIPKLFLFLLVETESKNLLGIRYRLVPKPGRTMDEHFPMRRANSRGTADG